MPINNFKEDEQTRQVLKYVTIRRCSPTCLNIQKRY